MRFHQLRGKGAFLVSAGWNATSMRLQGDVVTVESEVGGLCSVELPPSQSTDTVTVFKTKTNAPVPATRDNNRWNFQTKASETYTLSTSRKT
jgi:hypothetical protein